MNTEKIDFVYLIKKDEKGTELRYSLRSIAKWYPNNKIWIVGYKPSWVTDINFLPINEGTCKWKNLVNNLKQICECDEISEEFIYMNDDFFAINPTMPLEDIIDSNLGYLEKTIIKYKNLKTGWTKGFSQLNELLTKLNVKKPFYNYEAHLPLRINKKQFLEIISLPEVQKFIETPNVLHYRSLFRNYNKLEKSICLYDDVKVTKKRDTSKEKIKVCGWLSTADGLVGNSKFINLNIILRKNLSEPCKYEKEEIIKPKSIPKFKWSKFSQ